MRSASEQKRREIGVTVAENARTRHVEGVRARDRRVFGRSPSGNPGTHLALTGDVRGQPVARLCDRIESVSTPVPDARALKLKEENANHSTIWCVAMNLYCCHRPCRLSRRYRLRRRGCVNSDGKLTECPLDTKLDAQLRPFRMGLGGCYDTRLHSGS